MESLSGEELRSGDSVLERRPMAASTRRTISGLGRADLQEEMKEMSHGAQSGTGADDLLLTHTWAQAHNLCAVHDAPNRRA